MIYFCVKGDRYNKKKEMLGFFFVFSYLGSFREELRFLVRGVFEFLF